MEGKVVVKVIYMGSFWCVHNGHQIVNVVSVAKGVGGVRQSRM